ncbi:MAG: Undecaprenyl-phosphate mannosyltransferase, partial [Clostridiales bacterium]|nr:Undecaprenyl-phosphate mannosyltransferase [Clostridiales bacterium]
MSMNETLVIIPAYNEEQNISKVLNDIRSLNIDTDICVINDGSKDKTEEVVLKGNFNVVSLPYNLGYGAALQTGFKYAVLKDYKYVIQFDADGQHDPEDIKLILNELKKGDAEIVIGSRFLGRGSLQIGYMKKVAIAVFRFLIKFFTGTKISDPTSGLKGLTKPVFSFYSNMGRYPVD